MATIRHTADSAQAAVTLVTPTARRHLWWFSGECGWCGQAFVGRTRERDLVTTERRASCCGKWLTIKITHVHGEEADG